MRRINLIASLKVVLYLGFFFLSMNLYSQEKPNIIFILADDLGYGDLSCYGAKDLKTPQIDKLTQHGVKFTRAYANSTVCSPSRASILTGNYPDMVGVPGVIRDMPDNTWGNLKDDVITLPEALQKLNYNTALIGKWHLGYKSPDLPNNRGFDYFKGFVGDMMDDYYTHKRAGVNWMRENAREINPNGHATDLFTNWTLDYLQKQKKSDKPFFLFLTYNAPHDPVQPPMEWLNSIQKREKNTPLKRQKMIAFVEHLDFNIGRILEHLKRTQLDKNTIVVFTSDNGGALNYGANNQPFSGGKGDMLEGGIRIPCIVKPPNQSISRVIDTPLLLMDFYPTLLKFAGEGEINSELPSRSIVPLHGLTNSEDSRNMVWVRREGHKFGGRAYYAISDGRYKLLQNNPFSEYKLFDLVHDPKETIPLDDPQIKQKLKKALAKHIQTAGSISWQ
ncbi:sulfatase family protein [Algibacter luteus]|uniref:sulfatase family protein n=1 Tax=Algibacter luteus TaxID=1178825 RepID=UPI00259169CD|nr:sulfatase-like hydrolase/transferase [Algibacter luteus]WJJ95719.1 sulfatase-like hydrolase/transferase [Algibacter luteus]